MKIKVLLIIIYDLLLHWTFWITITYLELLNSSYAANNSENKKCENNFKIALLYYYCNYNEIG